MILGLEDRPQGLGFMALSTVVLRVSAPSPRPAKLGQYCGVFDSTEDDLGILGQCERSTCSSWELGDSSQCPRGTSHP